MRIDKVEIDGFGKLNNCSYIFSNGLNLIYGENESGKSTLCEFILAMFYGLPNKSKQSGDDMASRIKYRPWNSDAFGGRLYFTDDNGRQLIIERSFKSTKRGDKSTLRDALTWEEAGETENLGERYFGFSREGFLKTLYVKSFGADTLKSDDGEIMSKLSNLETSGNEDISYSKIINAMEKELFSLKTKTGRGGKITALEDKINALNSEKTLSQITYSVLEDNVKTAESLKETAKIKEQDAVILEKKYNLAIQHEKYLSQKKIEETRGLIENRLEAENEKLEKLKSQLENFDNSNICSVSAEELSRARALETKKLLAEEKIEMLKREIKEPVKTNGRITALIPVILGAVSLVLGVFTNVFILILGVLLLVTGIIVPFALKTKYSKENSIKEEKLSDAIKELKDIEEELSEIFTSYGVLSYDELSSFYISSQNKEQTISTLKQQYNEHLREIESLKASIPEKSETEIYSKEAIEYAGESSERIFEKINLSKAESQKMLNQANEIEVRIATETAEIRSENEIDFDLEETTKEKYEFEKRYKALSRAINWLNRAHDEIKNNFAPRLNKKTSELLSYLTDKKYADIRTNDNFSVNLRSVNGEIVEAEYLSRGTYDLVYIALRMASMSVLTDGKIPTVILDDAFSQLDNSRLLRAVNLIENDKEFSQVFLFTCHEEYKEILKNYNLIDLK